MTEEEVKDPWISWVLKAIAILFLTALPTAGILGLFLLFPWVSPNFAGPSMLLSGLTFLIGAAIFMSSQNARHWLYSIVIGYAVGFGGVLLGILEVLSHIPVPLFGNAFYATLTVVTVVVFTIGWLWPMERDSSGGVVTVDPILSSSKTIGQGSILGSALFDRREEKVLALGLIEIPHEYVYSEDGKQVLSDIIERFHSIARQLTDIPFGYSIQSVQGTIRLVFFTFGKDDVRVRQSQSRIQDALRHNLKGFRFDPIVSYSGPKLGENDVGSAAIITGVPLSIKDEMQKKDPLEAMAGVLRDIGNGMYQVFIEPYTVSKSKIRSLENQYRSATERSEITVSRESSGWLGQHQESKTTVNPKAKRDAEILERQIKRLSNPNLHKVTVSVLSWGKTIERVDHDTRRIAGALVGGLRPDNEQDEFKVEYKRKRKDLIRLMSGLPVGKSSILSSDQAAGYMIIPQTDLTIPVTKREKFSSGSKEPVAETVTVQELGLQLGHPIDVSGKILSNLDVRMSVSSLDMHLGVFGNTRSGKSTSVMSLVGQAINLGVNPIVLTPLKGYEWRTLLSVFPNIRIFTCGRSDISNLVINIWDPPENVQLAKWVDRIVQVWTLWLPNDQVISMHIEDVIYTVYKNCGWDLKTNRKGRPILLNDLVDAVSEVSGRLDYGDEVSSNVFGALVARVRSILRKPSLVDMLNTKTGITVSELLSHPTIIDMDALSENDKILLMGILTAAVSEYKLANPTKDVTNLLVLEEAHYLLSRTDFSGEANSGVRLQAVNAFIQMLRVLGGTGLGVVLIDQSPTTLVPQAIKIPVNLLIHALSDDEDRKLVGRHSRCTDRQIDHIGGMKVGETITYLQNEGEPKYVKMMTLAAATNKKIPDVLVDDATVSAHMKRIFEEHSHLTDSLSLPDDIMNRLRIKGKQTAEEPPQLGFEERVAKVVETSIISDYCEEHLANENPKSVVKLIKSISRRQGDGSYKSNLHVLLALVDLYKTNENHHVFMQVAEVLDGENA